MSNIWISATRSMFTIGITLASRQTNTQPYKEILGYAEIDWVFYAIQELEERLLVGMENGVTGLRQKMNIVLITHKQQP